ncbi:hypothetical protein SAMN05216391_108129 [Lachnospiraceae bacterium KHCPX20]|nr:hypothetical protein SAMN05216391_108129 [Lachnospiraceae bacterium KHCPX20]
MILFECFAPIETTRSSESQDAIVPIKEEYDIGFKTPVSVPLTDTFIPISFTDRIMTKLTDSLSTSFVVKTRTINKDLGLTSFNKKYLTTDDEGNIIPQTLFVLDGTRKTIDEGFLDEFDISSEYPDLKTVSNMEVV